MPCLFHCIWTIAWAEPFHDWLCMRSFCSGATRCPCFSRETLAGHAGWTVVPLGGALAAGLEGLWSRCHHGAQLGAGAGVDELNELYQT